MMHNDKLFDLRRLFGRGVARDMFTAVSLVLGIIFAISAYLTTGDPFMIILFILIVGSGVLIASHRINS